MFRKTLCSSAGVLTCARTCPPTPCRVRRRQPGCVRAPSLPSCSLMPFTCFNQHQSARGLQPFMLISAETGREKKEKRKAQLSTEGPNIASNPAKTQRGQMSAGETFLQTCALCTHARTRAQAEAARRRSESAQAAALNLNGCTLQEPFAKQRN